MTGTAASILARLEQLERIVGAMANEPHYEGGYLPNVVAIRGANTADGTVPVSGSGTYFWAPHDAILGVALSTAHTQYVLGGGDLMTGSLGFSDGFGLYFLNGSNILDYIPETPRTTDEEIKVPWVSGTQVVTVHTDRTAVGNTGAGEDTLWEYEMPAALLGEDGAYVELIVAGTYAANSNSKAVTLYLEANTLFGTGTAITNNGFWWMHAIIMRASNTSQVGCVACLFAGSLSILDQSKTFQTSETMTDPLTIKLTGTAVDTDDIKKIVALVKRG